MAQSLPRQQLENWVKSLEITAGKVLDIGGSQLPINGRVKVWEVEEYRILDLPKPHENRQAPDIAMDINFPPEKQLSMVEMEVAKSEFDVVFALELSEYLWNPAMAVANMNKFLKMYGKLYMSFHFNYPVHQIIEFDYLRYTKSGIKKIMDECGFKIEEMTPRTCAMNTGYQELMGFYSKQGMKWAKGSDEHTATGYLIKAIKIKNL